VDKLGIFESVELDLAERRAFNHIRPEAEGNPPRGY
jgi:hypothetical protein